MIIAEALKKFNLICLLLDYEWSQRKYPLKPVDKCVGEIRSTFFFEKICCLKFNKQKFRFYLIKLATIIRKLKNKKNQTDDKILSNTIYKFW